VSEQETCEKLAKNLRVTGALQAAIAVSAAAPFFQQNCKSAATTRSGSETSGLCVFVAAEKFVALNRGDDANGAFIARLGALNAAEAAHANRTSQRDFVREGEKNFDGRAFAYVLGKKEIDTA
jgi:hypothetical protein